MYEETFPRKRKNDDYSILAALLHGLWRLLEGAFDLFIVRPLRWTWRLCEQLLVWSWQATVWLLRTTWRLTAKTLGWLWRQTERVASWLWQATVWSVKAPIRASLWLLRETWALLFGRMPEFETLREREIWRRVRRRYRRRRIFMTNAFAFVFTLAIFWIQWFTREAQWREYNVGSYVAVLATWGFILLFHYVRLWMGEAEDDALEAALDREYEREARSRPLYYEEVEEFYGDLGDYEHLSDQAKSDLEETDRPKAKRRNSYS